ncbi:unnamed protein product [Leptosia nina]|uniref:NTF2 domain-containing protein n=1 Tax=Leptosia nina TaxID=320188 RepID=A0AAV1JAL6_9NEOP
MSVIKYKKFLLNRVTCSPVVVDYLESCLITEDNFSKYNFHKIMLHNWTDNETNLYEALSTFYTVSFIPINFVTQNGITTFYTSSLSFILKIIKMDFLFPYIRNMCSIDILLNDKTAIELFSSQVSIEEILNNVVNARLGMNFELNLSDFCNDKVFKEKKIHFYKLSLLAQFKILMLRIGKETKYLKLSYNNLSQVPIEVLNFFVKGDLIGIDLSYNNIPSLIELQRMSSKIEKLWLEGNPLCEHIEPLHYVKQISIKFPRLIELDGIRINNRGLMLPFFKTYLITPGNKAKFIVEKFITLYFSHYDSPKRSKLDSFYDGNASLSITTSFPDLDLKNTPKIAMFNKSLLDPINRAQLKTGSSPNKLIYYSQRSVVSVLNSLPATVHDRSTFTVDVLRYDKKILILTVDGVYREINSPMGDRLFNFRRTFVLNNFISNMYSIYHIQQEMFSVRFASKEAIENSFKVPIRNENQLSLINPNAEEQDIIRRVFSYHTRLRKSEAEVRLKSQDWDLKKALKTFCDDFKTDRISADKFSPDGDLSDISIDSEVD